MKSKLIPILIACSYASLAHAGFDPVPLTPASYTHHIVLPATAIEALPYSINVTAGSGVSKGDNTYYELGLVGRPGQFGGNSGIPVHNTTFTHINNANVQFLMPPDYTQNNTLMIDTTFTSGTITFNTATTATNLAILGFGGGGTISAHYTVTHADASTEVGTISFNDWFNGGSFNAWGANGRITSGGGYNNFNNSAVHNNPPFLHAYNITVSGASPVVSITWDTPSNGAHVNILGVSGNAAGAAWTPIPLAQSSFNVKMIHPALIPFPLTATMDQGTNLNYNGNLATFFEQGFVRNITGGLPVSGSTFTSFTQPTHTYQMGDYSTNDAILIDTNHLIVNITPVTPALFSTFAFLTAGGNINGIMTNTAILQHADGVNETNVFLAYDWFDQNHNGSIALKASGRVNMASRSVNQVGNNFPYLFETYFTLNDPGSPVTNIVVKYKSAINANSTTYIMAVSAAAGGVGPVVTSGPIPTTQTLFPGTNASFTVGVSGTLPITGFWQKQNNGTFVTLTDGPTGYGSTISGSQTFTLTISNLFMADGTNYQFVANNSFGTDTSPAGTLIVRQQLITITPAAPVAYTSNSIPLTANLSGGPAVTLQWYVIDTLSNSNIIAGATNSTYTITNAPLSLNGYTYGIIASNIYGINTASVVLSISDSAAFLSSGLVPPSGEVYVGAPVTYFVGAQGNSPISYQWIINGSVVNGATNSSYTFPATCGPTTVQAAVSNALSGGVSVLTSQVVLTGINPTTYTFNGSGIGWQTNGSIATISNNVLTLTDGGASRTSTAFLTNAVYVGGAWTASYIYNSHGGGADGTAFILQNTAANAFALGTGGGGVGYAGMNSNSLAFIINLYNGNGQTPGIALSKNGITGGTIYSSALPVSTTTTNDILVTLNWASGVLTATLKDTLTLATYTTNYTVGALAPILGANVAYVGFGGADGGVTSFQTVSNFVFKSVVPSVVLSVSPVTNNTFVISWPATDPIYQLQMTPSLAPASWVSGPAAVLVGGTYRATVSVSGSGQQFYRLIRTVCP